MEFDHNKSINNPVNNPVNKSIEAEQKLVVYYNISLSANKLKKSTNLSLDQQKTNFSNWYQTNYNNFHEAEKPSVIAEFIENYLNNKNKVFYKLKEAVNFCITNNANLVIARLANLIKNQEFANLLETPGLNFVCIDKPSVTPESITVVKQYVKAQSKAHGDSIKHGLKQSNKRSGNPNAKEAIALHNQIKKENAVLFAMFLEPIISQYRQQGLSQRKIVDQLNENGILAPEGGKWVLSQLQKVLKRVDLNTKATELDKYITEHNYAQYTAVDLVSALNNNLEKPEFLKSAVWDEDLLSDVLSRKKTIEEVLELYDFMSAHNSSLNTMLERGKDLDQIAQYFNNNSILVPKILVIAGNLSSDQTWNSKAVEELLKRKQNKLDLKYQPAAKEKIINIFSNYNGNKNLLKFL